jgi:hypothetical protein
LVAVILDQPVGSQHVAADLAAEVDFELGVLDLAILGALLVHLKLVEARPELLESAGAVLVLRTLVLALHDDAGGQVRHADG